VRGFRLLAPLEPTHPFLTTTQRQASTHSAPSSIEFTVIYLDSRFTGYDLNAMGFPSVETCMAVVLETKDWLVGWHAMNTGSLLGDAAAFGAYVAKMGDSKPVRLYGVTHLSRKASMKMLKVEMEDIADRMNYKGKVSCFHMPERRTPQQDLVLFNRRGDGVRCEVRYIDQRDVTHIEKQVTPSKTPHQVISGGNVGPLTTNVIDERTQTIVTSATSPIRVSGTYDPATLATIGDKDWTSFSV
jgi:hypothetical protein